MTTWVKIGTAMRRALPQLGRGPNDLSPDPLDAVPGLYKTRLVRKGPWVTVKIRAPERDPETGELLEDDHPYCEIDGKPADVARAWPFCLANPIDEPEFKRLRALREWAMKNAPDDPYANPTKPIDLNKAPTMY